MQAACCCTCLFWAVCVCSTFCVVAVMLSSTIAAQSKSRRCKQCQSSSNVNSCVHDSSMPHFVRMQCLQCSDVWFCCSTHNLRFTRRNHYKANKHCSDKSLHPPTKTIAGTNRLPIILHVANSSAKDLLCHVPPCSCQKFSTKTLLSDVSCNLVQRLSS